MIDDFMTEVVEDAKCDVKRPFQVRVWTAAQVAAMQSGHYNPLTLHPVRTFLFKSERVACAFASRLDVLREGLSIDLKDLGGRN